MKQKFALGIHGGAGTVLKSRMTPDLQAQYERGLAAALEAGHTVLANGGTALDAVTVAVCALEDDPLFNAGRGSVFTSAGKQEMDAAIMDGATRRAGAVGGIFGPRNPIRAARAVMERTDHVFMIGEGAVAVAREAGVEFADPDYFYTESRWQSLQQTLAMRARGESDDDPARRHGTVGAVALDQHGTPPRDSGRGGARPAREPGRRHLHRRDDSQGPWADRRHPGHRRRHLRR
ncbi:isoaspartyl peptidase/L-asparaginase [Chelativorans sp. Marseille-P2723]|uniref:isoaspartyl peptidase/L-asparaginase family protein n=1 Tax=Chelativorans sp. Marseille-P2723 TaxID=2709133 RepID=UPI0032B2DBBB